MTPVQRRLLLLISAACLVCWLCGIDRTLDAKTIAYSDRSHDLPAIHRERRVLDAIVRDPFARPPGQGVRDGASESPPFDTVPKDGVVAVPDIEPGEAARALPPVALRATIAGPSPVAYVDDGDTMQIVRIGDVVGGRNIASIDLQGISFTDGTRLDLPAASTALVQATPPRPARAETITLKLEDVRRLLRSSGVTNSPPAPISSSIPASPPSEPSYPSPAPLQSADAHGLPPGVNPTPNGIGPTPYPYAYPYAPSRH